MIANPPLEGGLHGRRLGSSIIATAAIYKPDVLYVDWLTIEAIEPIAESAAGAPAANS
jgi:hypothetical protein